MSVLANFPVVSQLTSITSDKRASENAGYDCVPGSIGACILWYQHKSQWDSSINPDMLKDLAYGEVYRNDGTAAITYVPICQKLGYKLYSIDGNNASLVQKAHELIQANIPVIFTEPDPYSSNPGDSHVCVFYGEGNGTLTALDPYIAKAITRTDGVWQSMLLFGQIWAMERLEDIVRIDITTPGVDHYFEVADAHHWRCKQTGHLLGYGMLDFYKGYGNAGLCGLTYLGLNKTDEVPIEKLSPAFAHFAGHGITVMFFERGATIYDPGHLVDNPPGAGSVYLLQLYNGGPGQDPGIAKLQATVTDLQNKLAQGQAVNPQLLPDMQQIKGISGKY